MRQKILPYIIALSALSVSGSAVFYSVYGLSKLFAGASTQVIIMTGSLEFAKLVIASLLYQYWSKLNKFLRSYLLIACLVLMVITSGGIYGFLSGAYQTTANQSVIVEKELAVIEMKRARFNETRGELKIEKKQLYTSITDLRKSISNPHQVQYIDRESGQLITTTSSSARRALKGELNNAVIELNNINLKLEAVIDSLARLDISVLNKETSNEAESELGPLRYISELTGKPMNIIVNWLLLLIIFVFDPLAVALVVTANFAFGQLRPKFDPKEYTVYKEGDEIAADIDLAPVEAAHSKKEDSIDLDSDVADSEESKAESVKAVTHDVSDIKPDQKPHAKQPPPDSYGGGITSGPPKHR